MKKIICLTFLLFAQNIFAQTSNQVVKIKIDDVVKKVSTENLEVYANALKVYQAEKSISVARGNLLPKLNFWRIISTPFDPRSLVGIVGDIAPFLIPSNWFNFKAEGLMYQAQRESYKALWANEVMTARGLYIHLLFDKNLLSHIRQSQKDIKSMASVIRSHEVLGGTPVGASRELEIRLLALEEDARALQMLIVEESGLLAYMMGYGVTTILEVEEIPMPNFDSFVPLAYESYEQKVLAYSPELKQYDFIIAASKYIKRTAQFSLFGVTDKSRGTTNGIFDDVPIQDGLGFGTPASIQVAKSKTEMLKVQKQGAEETLKRQLKLLVTNYNLDIENYKGLKRRVELTKQSADSLLSRMRLGEDIDTLQLVEASRNHVQADSALFGAQFRFLINRDKFDRLTFQGDYLNEPVSLNNLRGPRTNP